MNNIVKTNENLFLALGFPPHEAEVLQMRADLMAVLALHIREQGWTQQDAAERLGITQTRVSDLVRGKWKKFSLDTLVELAVKIGLRFQLTKAA